MYYIYVLRCEGETLYTGITTDIQRRFEEHISGRGAKYTRSHKPLNIAAAWSTQSKSDASKLEYRIKQLLKKDKEDLILSGEKTLTLRLKDREFEFKRIDLNEIRW